MKPTRNPNASLVAETCMFYEFPVPHEMSIHRSAIFGSSSSFPPLIGGGGLLVCKSVGKDDLMSDNFDSKKSRESVDLPLTCYPSQVMSP